MLPKRFPDRDEIATVREMAEQVEPGSADESTTFRVAGRVMARREMGKITFLDLVDRSGRIQLLAGKVDVALGDIIGVGGHPAKSRRGEPSLQVVELELLGKIRAPLPDTFHGLTDVEARYRKRYLDLLMNEETRENFLLRSRIVASIRRHLDAAGFVEVETPVLQLTNGGAAARPFRTHLNAFDLDMTLRIALELYLKRLIVGGVDRVFEIGRIFRNEGVDSTHSPEFTMLEFYEAYGDYDTVADLTREMVLEAARRIGRTVVPDGQGGQVDLEQPWRTATLHELVSDAVGEVVDAGTPLERVVQLAADHDVALQDGWDAGEVVLELFEQMVEGELLEPTFVRDYPVSVRPLARTHRDHPGLAEAWDLVVAGTELATGYSELVDPVEQRRRLTEQSLKAAGGDPEAMQLDEDFLRALEHGCPPMGGQGMGIDRLLMLLTGLGVRDVILFPLVKPEQQP